MRRVAILALVLGYVCIASACSSHRAANARFFLTTPRPAGSQKPCDDCLLERSRVSLESGSVQSDAITIDDQRRFQTIDGFGFAMTDSSAYLIDQLPNDSGQHKALMRKLFDRTDGIGISWMRIIMGPSDFTVLKPPWYSYQPTQADSFDVGRPRTGSPVGDYSHIIPLLREANVLAKGHITFFANPHSAPEWMKLNRKLSNLDPDSCILGYCNGVGGTADFRNDYVQYFIDFLKAYQEAGIKVSEVGVQNEPGSPADYPSGDFALPDQADFINRLKAAFARQTPALKQKVLGEFVNPVSAKQFLANAPNSSVIDGISYHCYGFGKKTLQEVLTSVEAIRTVYPHKSINETECTQDSSHFWPSTIDILIDHARRGANSIANWNVALNPRGGPHSSLCSVLRGGQCFDTNTGSIMSAPVVISGPRGRATATLTREYYEMGHFTKFILPGAVRISSSELDPLKNVAFRNPDGSEALVVHNVGGAPRSFNVNVDSSHHFFVKDLPAGSIATFTW